MIYEIPIFDNWLLGLLLFAGIAGIAALIANMNDWIGTTVFLVIIAALLEMFTSARPYDYLYQHTGLCLAAYVGYLIVGVVSARLYWRWLMGYAARVYGICREEASGHTTGEAELAREARTDAARKLGFEVPPVFDCDMRARVITWVFYWPLRAPTLLVTMGLAEVAESASLWVTGQLKQDIMRAFSAHRKDLI